MIERITLYVFGLYSAISVKIDIITGKHGKIDPVGTDEIDPVKTA